MAKPETNKSKQEQAKRGNAANAQGRRSGDGGIKQRTILGKVRGR